MSENAVLRVDPTNVEQAKAWDGDEGEYWAANAERFDRALAEYHRPFLDAAGIGSEHHVLDIGCGTGQTTRDAARIATGGWVLGVDLSSRMVDVARELAAREGVTNVEFLQADAQVHEFAPGSFDVAISRTGAMFFGDPDAAFANIASALRPGGRLILLTWQPPAGNEWIRGISSALAAGRDFPTAPPDTPGPFALSDPDRVRAILGEAGFSDVELYPSTRPMRFGVSPNEAEHFILGLMGWMLQGLDDNGHARAVDALRTTIAAHHTRDGVLFDSAAWTIHATRRDGIEQ